MRMSRWIGVLTFVALGCVACGGEAPESAAGPSTTVAALPGPSSATQGAKIVGNVSAGVPLAAVAAQVGGTSISSPVGTGGGSRWMVSRRERCNCDSSGRASTRRLP